MDIEVNKLSNFISDYLAFGFKEEEFKITKLEIQDKTIISYVDLTNCFVPQNDEFHFTVPLAFRIISQLAIIFTCHDRNYNRKPGEVFLREINLKCKKNISKLEDVKFSLKMTSFKSMGDYFFYSGTIDIEDGAFYGNGSLIIPKLEEDKYSVNSKDKQSVGTKFVL